MPNSWRFTVLALSALAVLDGGPRLLAQSTHANPVAAAQLSPPAIAGAIADSLQEQAERLYALPAAWGAAARLLLESAALRPGGDPRRLESMRMAARLFGYSSLWRDARSTMTAAADELLAFGDLVGAAQAEVDAAFMALRQGRITEALQLAARARWLAGQPGMEAGQRAAILARVDGSPRAAERSAGSR